jgi:hypothetical protein
LSKPNTGLLRKPFPQRGVADRISATMISQQSALEKTTDAPAVP